MNRESRPCPIRPYGWHKDRRQLIYRGDDIDKRHGVWSATKSFTSTVLGLLIADGRCTLDTRVADVLPELKANNKCFIVPEWEMVIVRLGLDGKAKDDVWNSFLARVAESIKKP